MKTRVGQIITCPRSQSWQLTGFLVYQTNGNYFVGHICPYHNSFLSKPTWEILKYCSATCLFHPITSRYASLDLRGTNPTVGVLLLPTDMTRVLNYFWWMVLWAGGGGGGHSTSPPTPPRHCWSVVGMRSSLRPNTSSCTDLSWPAGTNSRLGGRKGALSQSSSA